MQAAAQHPAIRAPLRACAPRWPLPRRARCASPRRSTWTRPALQGPAVKRSAAAHRAPRRATPRAGCGSPTPAPGCGTASIGHRAAPFRSGWGWKVSFEVESGCGSQHTSARVWGSRHWEQGRAVQEGGVGAPMPIYVIGCLAYTPTPLHLCRCKGGSEVVVSGDVCPCSIALYSLFYLDKHLPHLPHLPDPHTCHTWLPTPAMHTRSSHLPHVPDPHTCHTSQLLTLPHIPDPHMCHTSQLLTPPKMPAPYTGHTWWLLMHATCARSTDPVLSFHRSTSEPSYYTCLVVASTPT